MLGIDPEDLRAMFRDLSRNEPDTYNNIALDDFFLGVCMARGMSANEAVKFVTDNSVQEDSE